MAVTTMSLMRCIKETRKQLKIVRRVTNKICHLPRHYCLSTGSSTILYLSLSTMSLLSKSGRSLLSRTSSSKLRQSNTKNNIGGLTVSAAAVSVVTSGSQHQRRNVTTHSQLPDEHRMVYEMCRKFADEVLAPNAGTWDQKHEFPKDAIQQLVNAFFVLHFCRVFF